jgi:hypothetical protein
MQRTLGALALAGVLTLSGCGASGEDALRTEASSQDAAAPASLAYLAQASAATRSAENVRVRQEVAMVVDDGEMQFDGTFVAEVAQNLGTEELEMEMDLSDLADGMLADGAGDDLGFSDMLGGTTEIVVADGVAYVRSGLLQAFTGVDSDAWLSSPVDSDDIDISQAQSVMAGGDALLEALAEVGGSPETVGQEQIDGVQTTHYRAEITPDELVEVLGDDTDSDIELLVTSVPLDLWIDDNDQLRRFAIVLDEGTIAANDSGLVSMSAVVTWSAIGEDFDVVAPQGEIVPIEEAFQQGGSFFEDMASDFAEGFEESFSDGETLDG